MDSSKNFKKFQELEKQAKEFVTRNNINAFNLGVNEGIAFSVTLIEELLKDLDNDNVVTVKTIEDLKAKLLQRVEY